MKTIPREKAVSRSSDVKKACMLAVLFGIIVGSILIIRSFPLRQGHYTDRAARQIQREMEDSRIELSSGVGRRTVVDFSEPVILNHGQESQLIVYTAQLSETLSIANEGLGGWAWTSAYQDIEYTGEAQYTVDLSLLTEADFVVNNELKTLTVRIPYAVLSLIHIPPEQIRFRDVQKGWAAPKDIKLTPEEHAQLLVQVNNLMKAKLIDDNIIALANESAKSVVADLITATVHSIDPEFTVIIVQ